MSNPVLDCQYPETLRSREGELLEQRRATAGIPQAAPPIGVALSGGGIRSATFSLGFFQGLSRAGLLPRVDYLSSVSGGGYFSAFLGAMLSRGSSIAAAVRMLTTSSSRPMRWLRDNGRYLAPNGAGDRLLAQATIIRNWSAIAVVMGTLLMALLLGAHTLRVVARDSLSDVAGFARVAAFVRELGSWHGIYWSPLLLPPIAVFVVCAVPFGWAHWLGRLERSGPGNLWVWGATLAVGVFAYFQPLIAGRLGARAYGAPMTVLQWLAVLTLLIGVELSIESRTLQPGISLERVYRNLAARRLTACLMIVGGLLILGVVDTLGQSLYVFALGGFPSKTAGAAVTALGAFLAAVQRISSLLETKRHGTRIRLPLALVAGVAALIVAGALATMCSAVGHGIARGWKPPLAPPAAEADITLSLSENEHHVVVEQTVTAGAPTLPPSRKQDALLATVVFAVFAALFGHALPFVNLSSLSNLYAARLSRAYVGATNPNRQKGGGVSLTAEVEGDDLPMSAYGPHRTGGPIHLINVTLNETVGGESQIEFRDRKGLAMAIGPAGISVGVRHHAVWNAESSSGALTPIKAAARDEEPGAGFHIWSNNATVSPETLGLSAWTAISGAAVSPGLGARTSIGLSLLLGMANIRLGYWWDSASQNANQGGAKPKPLLWLQRRFSRAFPVQSALMQELLAQFDGPHQRYWFLTDGGHFENTGCYELLRRRVPIIICCDDGADPDYTFEDLSNLVRTARTDFAADVDLDLFGRDNVKETLALLSPRCVDSLSELRPKKLSRKPDAARTAGRPLDLGVRLSHAHVTIARVLYNDDPTGVARPRQHSIILFVKPTLTGDEPVDVLQYAASHGAFPQETTADQFFDEAQWESYRKLGEHVAEHLLNGLDLEQLYTALAEAS